MRVIYGRCGCRGRSVGADAHIGPNPQAQDAPGPSLLGGPGQVHRVIRRVVQVHAVAGEYRAGEV